jgi:methyl-accepting chemotaxis protein
VNVVVVFGPAAWLLGRLQYRLKFVLIGLVLLAPLAYIGNEYVNAQHAQIAFNAKERVGVVYVKPAARLLEAIIKARAAAVRGRHVDAAPINAAVTAMDSVDQKLGASLETTQQWSALRDAIVRVTPSPPNDPKGAFDAYNELADKTVGLITQAGNISNLILDPDLDSFWLMDTVVVELPSAADNVGRAADLQQIIAGTNPSDPKTLIRRIDLAIAEGTFRGHVATINDPAFKTAFEKTKDISLKLALSPLLEAENAAVSKVSDDANVVVEGGAPSPAAAADGAAAVSSSFTLYQRTLPKLDQLIQTRLSGVYQDPTTRSEWIVAICVLIGIYLFVGFFLSVRRSVKGVVTALDAAYDGDFTTTAEVETRDEIGAMAATLARTMQKMQRAVLVVDSIGSKARALTVSSDELSDVSSRMEATAADTTDRISAVSSAAEQVAASVQAVAASTQEMSASIRDIAERADEAAKVANEAVETAAHTNEAVSRLDASSAEIGDVVKLITAIVSQTNLLALNASIEAARAGEAGRGFAVVAGEVRDLATETARATETISSRINANQQTTGGVVASIAQITKIVQYISEIQTSTAGALERQAAMTAEIGRSAAEAAAGTEHIAVNINAVTSAAASTSAGASATQHSAAAFSSVATDLEQLVASFRL